MFNVYRGTAPEYLTNLCSRCNDHHAHQHMVTLLSDGQGHALLTAHLLLQVRLRGTHLSPTENLLVFYICRLHCVNCGDT